MSFSSDSSIVTIGWGDPQHSSFNLPDSNDEVNGTPNSKFSNAIRFNFHITLDGFYWNECHDYHILASLDSAITANNEEFLHIQFPDLSDTVEMARVLKCLRNESEFNIDGIKVLERHRSVLQRWANFLFTHIDIVDDDCRQVIKQLFFRSSEKIAKFEKVYGQCGRKKSSRPLDVNFLSVASTAFSSLPTSSTPKTSPPSSSSSSSSSSTAFNFNRPRASSDTEETPFFRRVTNTTSNNKEDTYSSSLTANALQTQQKQLQGKQSTKKRVSSLFGIGGSKRSTRSVDPSSVARDKEKQRLQEQDREQQSELGSKASLLKVAVQRGQEVSRSGVLLYEVTLKVVGRKYAVPISYTTQQRFSKFKQLCRDLYRLDQEQARLHRERSKAPPAPVSAADYEYGDPAACKPSAAAPYENFMDSISASFPLGMKTLLGLSLSDSDLSERTRRLDAWLRDLCYNYRSLPAGAKQLVRDFLQFDMSRPMDIFIQDQLAWGLIEAPRGETPILIVQKSALSTTMSGDMLEQLETMSNSDSIASSGVNRVRLGGGRVGSVVGSTHNYSSSGSSSGAKNSSRRYTTKSVC